MLKLTAFCPKAQFAPPLKNCMEIHIHFKSVGDQTLVKKKTSQTTPPKKECMGNAIHYFSKSQKTGGGNFGNFASYFDHFVPPSYILRKQLGGAYL